MNFYAILFKSLLYYERQCEFSHCLSIAHCLAPSGQPAMTAKKSPISPGEHFISVCAAFRCGMEDSVNIHTVFQSPIASPLRGNRQ